MEEKDSARKTKEVEGTARRGEKKVTFLFKVWKKRHNKTTCPEPSSSTSKLAKKARSCSICKKEGHTRLKCPEKPPEPTLIDMDEEKVVGPAVI